MSSKTDGDENESYFPLTYSLFTDDHNRLFGVRPAEIRGLRVRVSCEHDCDLLGTAARLHSNLHVELSLSGSQFPRKFYSLRSCSPGSLRSSSAGSRDQLDRLGQKYN